VPHPNHTEMVEPIATRYLQLETQTKIVNNPCNLSYEKNNQKN